MPQPRFLKFNTVAEPFGPNGTSKVIFLNPEDISTFYSKDHTVYIVEKEKGMRKEGLGSGTWIEMRSGNSHFVIQSPGQILGSIEKMWSEL